MFLDLSADRYFCLSPRCEQSFGRLIDRAPLSDDDTAALETLSIDGPITACVDSTGLAPCAEPCIPPESLLDIAREATSYRELLLSGSSLIAAPTRLRLCGLRATIDWLSARKAAVTDVTDPTLSMPIAAAFATLRLIATERDNCLTRSIAVTSRLISVGAKPELVIGVKLQPFAAHAWAQCDNYLVNDRFEFVRDYTPILVV